MLTFSKSSRTFSSSSDAVSVSSAVHEGEFGSDLVEVDEGGPDGAGVANFGI